MTTTGPEGTMAQTQHTCGGPRFGRKTPGCPRCDELLAGAAPRPRFAPAEPAPVEGTRHNHELLPFGRKVEGCPRCTELTNGAPPRRPDWVNTLGSRAAADAQSLADVRAHFASAGHRNGDCGPVCTFGDW